MRVLVTGMTKQHIGGGNQIGYEPVADLFARAFELLGNDVDHRRAVIGEDLTGYGLVVVGVVPPLSVATNYLHSALWVIHECERTGVPLMFFVDDWQFTSITSKLGTVSRDANHLTKPFFAGRPDHEWALANVGLEMAVVHRLLEKDWPATLIPAFTWGDHTVLRSRLPRATGFVIDPSVLARAYPVEWPEQRERRWVLGTVSDQRGWLETVRGAWPVEHVGGRASKAARSVPEAELVQLYADSCGVLSPPYTATLGTGWWRNRFVHAARTRAVLLADPREAPRLGDAYCGYGVEVIEAMTDPQLVELAAWQCRTLQMHQMTPGEIGEQLQRAVEWASA